MSGEHPSSNPFRRKDSATAVPVLHSALAHSLPPLDTSFSNSPSPVRGGVKPVKKVRVQSPPPSSPEDNSIPNKLPTPITHTKDLTFSHNDPFEIPESDASSDLEEETLHDKPTGAPMNPFHKTLATLEHSNRDIPSEPPPPNSTPGAGAGRASLDVDAFKRLLLTGNAGVGITTSNITATPPTNLAPFTIQDGGSSTETSSISRHSMFEPLQEPLAESPRTSHEISDMEDERQRTRSDSHGSTSERHKPLPPSHKHGKLIKVELKDDNLPIGTRGTLVDSMERSQSPRYATDLNKPLPTPPVRLSYESDHESIFDREAAGKTPEPASPTYFNQRKTPPAPPLTRRQSQLISDPKLTRRGSLRTYGSLEDEGDRPAGELSNSQLSLKAPPPPPSRRPQTQRQTSQTSSISSPVSSSTEAERSIVKANAAPAPPPTRTSSGRKPGRPSSVSSLDISSKRQPAMPPPPPPRQRASSKTSIDTTVVSPLSGRPSGEFRQSMESARETFTASHSILPRAESTKPANDILADITALQREIDALRGYSENRHTG